MNTTNVTEYHILGTNCDSTSKIRRVVEKAASGAVLIDLSAGQLASPHKPHRHVSEEALEKIIWINGQDFADDVGDSSREAYIEWLSNAANQTIAHGSSIKEWFTYRGEISLWWFTSLSMKHPTDQPQRWFFYQVSVIEYLTRNGNCENTKWQIWASAEETRMLREAIPSSASVVASTVEQPPEKWVPYIQEILGTFRLGLMTLVLAAGALHLLDTAMQFFHANRELDNASVSDHQYQLLHPEARTQPLVLIQTLFPESWAPVPKSLELDISSEWYDHYFGDSPAQLNSRGYQVAWMPSFRPWMQNFPTDSGEEISWKEVKKSQSIPEITSWMGLKYSDVLHLLWHQIKWISIYIYLFVIRNVGEKWSYNGVTVGKWFRNAYKWPSKMHSFKNIEKYQNACKILKPDVVLYRDEFYLTGREVSAAANTDARLVGVQHGLINREHTVYQWASRDISNKKDENKSYISHVPCPEWFASFGSHYVRKFKEWNGYPERRVLTIGGLRHDTLVENYKLREKTRKKSRSQALRKEYGIPQDKTIVLLCTATKESSSHWFNMTVEAIRESGIEYFIVVKTHQYHGGKNDIRRIAYKKRFDSFKVIQKDIYQLMEASDILVAGASTTILDAQLFGLPCIAICASKKYPLYPFEEDELASMATCTQEIGKCLKEFSRKEKDYATKRKVNKHLNNLKENAVSRLSNKIDSLRHGNESFS